jgi:hypothetical protein
MLVIDASAALCAAASRDDFRRLVEVIGPSEL